MTMKVSHQMAKFKKVWRYLCRNTDSHYTAFGNKKKKKKKNQYNDFGIRLGLMVKGRMLIL